MNILITGGTGFIGSALSLCLLDQGHTLIVLTRQPEKIQSKNIRAIDSFDNISSQEKIEAIINLAGEGIADKRWSKERKKVLEASRVDLTADLVKLIRRLDSAPKVLISGSAVGYYGDCADNIVTEFSEPHDEFSHRLCAAWETQALRAKADGVRVCIVRTGLVLGKDGGFIQKLLPLFRLGLGARLADGNQWMSWVHLDDMVKILLFLLNDDSHQGIYNATAPNPVTNKIFTKMLASVLRRPTFLVLPKSILNYMYGEMSSLLVTGQRVLPKRLEQSGFEYKYKAIKPALIDVCSK